MQTPSRALPRIVAGGVIALWALLPRPGRGTVAEPPRVDLGRIELSDGVASAPTAGGERAELTLDVSLQRAAYRLLARAYPVSGAAMLVDARRGHVLAYADYRRADDSRSVLTDASSPAASLFKIVTTAALLEQRVRPNRRVCTSGGAHGIEEAHLKPPRRGHALCAPFSSALGHSRNAAYAQLATRFLEPDELLDTAARFGFGQKAPFDIPAPVGNIELPDDRLGFARAAAGFEGTTLSPVGAAHLAYTIALGGRAARMHIVARAGGFEAPRHRQIIGRVLDPWVAGRLREMMEVTVHGGTSLEAFTNDDGRSFVGSIRVAGKTGTLKPRGAPTTTSWFIGFAPSLHPRVVLSVRLDNSPVWRRKANEVARDLFRVYFAERGAPGVTDPFGSG